VLALQAVAYAVVLGFGLVALWKLKSEKSRSPQIPGGARYAGRRL